MTRVFRRKASIPLGWRGNIAASSASRTIARQIGIGHYEGRGWRGFHHHATLCIAAYAFLISERETIPPSGSRPAGQREKAGIPEGYRPRRHAAQAGEAHTELHRDAQTQDRRGLGQSFPRCPCCGSTKQIPNYQSSL